MMRASPLSSLLCAALIAASALPVYDATACGNTIRHQRIAELPEGELAESQLSATERVLRAQQLVEKGGYQDAMGLLVRTYPELMKLDDAYKKPQRFKATKKDYYYERSGDGLQHAARVAALCIVRSRSQVKVDKEGSIHKISARQTMRQLDWALGVWRHAVKQDPTSPERRNYLGESLMQHPKGHAEAAQVLEALKAEALLFDRGAKLLADHDAALNPERAALPLVAP